MKVLHTISEIRQYRRALPPGTATPFVPTMGALHEGHASLVRAARRLLPTGEGRVFASIFVNPTQFGPREDFSRYPRTLETDISLLEAGGCDALFVPAAEEMYPGIRKFSADHARDATSIDPGPLADVLEGAIRPGHFRGVCTVVAKLLHIVDPSPLLLGQKDYQQQAILRQMCADLNMPVEVVTCRTIREPDGLAMSSRNRYLSADERRRAAGIYEALSWAKAAYAGGERRAAILETEMSRRIAERGLTIQYAVAAHAQTLALCRELGAGLIEGPAVLLIAAVLGSTRLIDNLLL
jgi:pantoate--beta-alanine ligase